MTMTQSDGPSRWKVIGQRQSTGLLPDGTAGQVVEVTFQLIGDGTVGRVQVPAAGFNVDTVAAAINAHADQLEAVRNLQG